LKNIF
jgi:hypothetical protein